MAETEECAHRACFRIAEVTVMHSVVIRATGSTAIVISWTIGAVEAGTAVAAAFVKRSMTGSKESASYWQIDSDRTSAQARNMLDSSSFSR